MQMDSDLTSKPWYKSHNYERYWEFYKNCMSYAHQDFVSRCSYSSDSITRVLYNMVSAPLPSTMPQNFLKNKFGKGGHNSISSQSHYAEKRKKKKIKKNMKKRKRKEFNSYWQRSESISSIFQLGEDDTLESKMEGLMHCSAEKGEDKSFLSFMEQSLKHRLKWMDVKKKRKMEDENMMEDQVENQLTAEEEHPDIVRSRFIKNMYGSRAPQLHAMETAMQLSFDRISTMHQPVLWPNIAFNINL